MKESDIAMIRINIEATNQLKSPIFSVGGYTVLDLLGSGSFGSVYKVNQVLSHCLPSHTSSSSISNWISAVCTAE